MTTTASAITANDIRGVYGVSLGKDVTPLIAEAEVLAGTIKETRKKELRNSVIEEYSADALEVEIEQVSSELRDLAAQLDSAIDMPLEDMLRAEAAYTSKVDQINKLLRERDVLISYEPEDIEIGSAQLELTREELLKEIEEAGYYEDIGEWGVWPAQDVQHKINSNWGNRWDPITKNGYRFHSGIDLYAPMSTPVVSTFAGVVYKTGRSDAGGNYVYVDHGYGFKTFYCHLSEIKCKEGDVVNQGDVIALSGNTGSRTTGPHLHYSVYIDGTSVDPKMVLPDV